MPARERVKTKYPGVHYVNVDGERVYYIVYRRKGETRVIEEKAFIPRKTMTPALANQIRSERIKGKSLTNKEQRRIAQAEKEANKGRMTFSRLWELYKEDHKHMASFESDASRYKLFILPSFGYKEPRELIPLDIDRLKRKVLSGKADQTVKHVLGLLERIARHGAKKQLCPGISFQIEKPSIDNLVTETLSKNQLNKLLQILDESEDLQIAAVMKLALFTGMRRGELFKLQWSDIDFEQGFIYIRSPKGKKSIHIPLNESARRLLENHPRTGSTVFLNDEGQPFSDPRKRINAIKEAAGLPEEFRPMHGLRHVYASLLASSGRVDIYTLQRLLTHKSTSMTQRYAHIMDQALKNASRVIVDTLTEVKKKGA